jgi:hypothetical protein
MPSTYTTNLGIEKIATGEQSGTWGNTTNTNLDILDQSIDGIISITLVSAGSSGSPNSLPITDGAVSNGRNKFIEFVDGGDLGATAYVQLTPNDSEKIVHIRNSLSASRSIIVFQGTYNASNDYEILNGEDVLLKFDGAGAGAVVSQVFANLALPSVNIDGGTIDGAVIGGASAAAGSFTTLSAADGSALTPSITNTGDTNTGIFFPAADTVGVAVGGTEIWRYGSNPTTAKNLIDNGAMTVAQRGTLTGQGPNNEYTGLDRFAIEANGSIQARFTTSQDTDVPAGAGFGYSLKVDCTTAEVTVASADGSLIAQRIEAQNLQHLDYGAAGAKTLVASFWMKSPKSGTHCVSLDQPDGGSTYIREFTVASADTWEKHTVTFPGDASGTINNDTGAGLELKFPLFMGATYQGTADTWTGSGTQWATSNQQNLLDNTANNFYITGVQLEVGSVATDFEHEDYDTTYQKCRRYLRAYVANGVNRKNFAFGHGYNTTRCWFVYIPDTPMRGTIAVSYTGTAASIMVAHGGGTATATTGTPSVQSASLEGESVEFLLDAASGTPFTVGDAVEAYVTSTSGTSFLFSSEL